MGKLCDMAKVKAVFLLCTLLLVCCHAVGAGSPAVNEVNSLLHSIIRREVLAATTKPPTSSSGTSSKNFITYLIVGCVGAFIIASLVVAIYYAVCKDKGVKTKHDTWVEAGVEIYGVLPTRSTAGSDNFKRLSSDATSVGRVSRVSDVTAASKRSGRFSTYKAKGPNEENIYADVVETIHRLKAERYLDEFARKPYGRDQRGRRHRRSLSRSTSISSQSRHSRGCYSEADVDTRRRVHSLDMVPSRPPGSTSRRAFSVGSQSYLNGIEEEDASASGVLEDGTALKSAMKWPSVQVLPGVPYAHAAYAEGYPGNDASGYFSDGYVDEGYDHSDRVDLGYFNAAGFRDDHAEFEGGYSFNDGFNGGILDGPIFGQFEYPIAQELASPENVLQADEQDSDCMERPYGEATHRVPVSLGYSGYGESHSFRSKRASFHQSRRGQPTSHPEDARLSGLDIESARGEC